MCFWIMVQERDEYVFICLIRRDADLLVLSMMSEFFESAEANREHAVSGRKVSFELTSAEKYTVPSEVDRCYFLIRFCGDPAQSSCWNL